MMTTSYPHNPGMPPQGMPQGHPMGGPGGPNPAHQMHPAMHQVSGPNGPVSQAGPMMGMQPGMVGANAHAMQHLQPQQQHMFAQQQHPGMLNPAMLQQQRNAAQQHAFMRSQQQQQAMMQQQQQAGGGMPMGFPNAMANMTNLTPQQMQVMRQMGTGGLPNLPTHLQLQQQQQQMQMQQQGGAQHQAAMLQAQHHNQQQQQMQQQQQQQAQAQAQAAHVQANAIAMQHANSQQSNHSLNANQGPPSTSQPQQGPLRPPSAMSHQGHASPAPPPTPQQAPPPQQPPPQQPPQQSGPQPGQQTPAPSQPPNIPQQPNQQPQNPAQAQQQRNPAMVQQVQAQAQAQAVQAQAQAAQVRNMAMMKQAQAASVGNGALKLMNFMDQINRYTGEPGSNTLERWQAFVEKFFNETGAFIHVVSNMATHSTKQFEIVYAALPRYFYTLFNNTDVINLQITLDGPTEKAAPPELKVFCDRAKFIYTYRNQCQVVYSGKLTAFWSGSDRMEWLQFNGESHQQYIPRAALEPLFHQPSPNQMNPNQSPRMNKNAKQKLQQQRAAEPQEPYLPMSKLPTAGAGDFGLPPILVNYLEIYETMNHMSSLMGHYLENPSMNTAEALDSWIDTMSANNPTIGQQTQGQNPGQPNQMQQPNMPPGVRPGPGQMFMSPAIANSLLPNGVTGSPGMMHTPSPNSHSMVKQQSTSSHTASVNTSPNMQNKRRRSTAKIDLDDGEGMNGTKVKQSPRVGGGKRMKGGG